MITLYLDMDGVLCDFQKAYRVYEPEKPDAKRFHQAVMEYHIFEDLEMMPDAQQLLNYVSKLSSINIEILTSLGTFNVEQGNAAKHQKIKWLNNHSIPYKSNFVRCKEEKAKYATPYTILVDDSIGCIEPFNALGGHGILHVSSAESIEQIDQVIHGILAINALRRIST